MSSRLTAVFSGASSSFQLGNSSLSARGSNTAPDRMCAPTSEPFSTTQTLISWPASAAFCFSRQAADRPAGPAPTITTPNSMYSRSIGFLLLRLDYSVDVEGCDRFPDPAGQALYIAL